MDAKRIEELRECLILHRDKGLFPLGATADLLALLDAAEPKAAPSATEEERALNRMDEAIGDAYAHRQVITTQRGYTDADAREDFELDEAALATLRAALEDYERVKAEGERWRTDAVNLSEMYGRAISRAEKAEAELERVRPLVEAVMDNSPWRDERGVPADPIEAWPLYARKAILRAALQLREAEKKGGR